MTHEDFTLCEFDRRHFGRKNEFVFRHHSYHAEQAAKAIQKRRHPAWSQLACDYRVA